MTTSFNVGRRFPALLHRGKSRTASGWKCLWSRNQMCSLKQPALVANLQSCERKSSRRLHETNQFPVIELGTAPCFCNSGSTVGALATYAVTELHPHIVRVDRPVGTEHGKGFIKHAALAVRDLRWRERKAYGAPWATRIVRMSGGGKVPTVAVVVTIGIVVDRAFIR